LKIESLEAAIFSKDDANNTRDQKTKEFQQQIAKLDALVKEKEKQITELKATTRQLT
jgi:hypothetical protein